MARNDGWIPQQHGAWAMLVVPFLCGVTLRAAAGDLPVHLAALLPFWLVGYMAFNAASLWLKAPPARRGRLRRPLVVWLGASSAAGLLTLALAGARILWWAPWYLPLLVPALVLASRRRERATLGGALTVVAASLMTLVARFTSPADLPGAPDAALAVGVAAANVAYFFGTVLYVKTNIRERGNRTFLVASLAWHAAATAAAALASVLTGASVWWTVFFAATLARAIVVPRLQPRLTPLRIGLIEIVLSVCLVLVVALG